MSNSKPQIVYGASVFSTEVYVLSGHSVRPLRHPNGQPVLVQAVTEEEPSEEFCAGIRPGLEAERLRLQAELDAQSETPEPEAPNPSVVDELVPEALPEEPVTVIDPKRAE